MSTEALTKLQNELFELRDSVYRDFNAGLCPTVDKDKMIGVRTPLLRKKANCMIKSGEYTAFLQSLPHKYFEENQLHAFIISQLTDFDKTLEYLERFLPYIDNWATCDQLRPKVFKKHTDRLISHIYKWLGSGHTYTVRFGIGMLMLHYLGDRFKPEYMQMVADIHSDEYYVNMMTAWYFATALSVRYDSAVEYLQNKNLSRWVHNKTVQKACESRCITNSQKEYLKSLKI